MDRARGASVLGAVALGLVLNDRGIAGAVR